MVCPFIAPDNACARQITPLFVLSRKIANAFDIASLVAPLLRGYRIFGGKGQ
jgi:hypothetical protein